MLQTDFRMFFQTLSASILMALGGFLQTGCVMMDPGGQTRKAFDSQSIKEWGETGVFRTEFSGPQSDRYLMLQGSIVMKEGAEGKQVVDWENSAIEYYLESDPATDNLANSFSAAMEASVKQSEAMTQMMTTLIGPLLQSLVPGVGGAPAAQPPPIDIEGLAREILVPPTEP